MLQPAEQTRRRVAACLASLATALIVVAAQTPVTPDVWGALTFRHVGPQGNRVVAVAGIPGDANVLYAGAASGGIFKSMDAGVHWMPIFDGQIVASIGALAVAPSDPNVVWAGTGEAFIRGNISIGNGAYKSTDAGRTWTHSGLDATGRIGRVVIHPTDPDIVFVAAMGHCYGPQPERGVFRTLDGGKTWDRVLFVDEHTGAIDIVVEPSNPRILFASTWQLIIRPWGRESGGPAAACTCRATVGRHGRGLRVEGFQIRRWAYWSGVRAEQPQPRLRAHRERHWQGGLVAVRQPRRGLDAHQP
jgi:photosystem II stability/assembly factor-like uncharacterized protein